ncbi:MAG: hypothetical protein ACLURP_08365 [Ruminococcus sp.]
MVFIFAYIPMGGVILAFKQFRYDLGIFGSPFVGWDNFKFFFQSGDALNVTRNTVLYNLAFLIVNTTLEVGFAIVLSEMVNKVVKKNLTVCNLSAIFYFLGNCKCYCIQPF